MYCRKLNNGKWSCTADATPDPLTGKRRQVTRRGDTKKEAQQRTREAVEQLSTERKKEKKTVNEVFDEWIKVYALSVRPSTVQIRRTQTNKFLEEHGNHYIASLATKDIQDHLIARSNSGLSDNFLSSIRTALNLLFKYALKNDYVSRNIVESTTLPKSDRTTISVNPPKKYLEKDEVKKFLTGLKRSERRNVYELALLMLSTGLRIGEALALTWDDINLTRKELTVNKTLYSRGSYSFLPPKTPTSYRTVSFNDELHGVLQKMKVLYNKEILIGLRDKDSEWCNLVFANGERRPVHSSNINAIYNKIYKIYGIEGASGSHILRHTHITMLVEAGVDLPVIMERVGHSNINITLDIYTHVTKKMQESSDQKINDYFKQFISL